MTASPEVQVPKIPFASRPPLLKFYFVLACITGTTITILELIALPLTWWAHSPQLGDIIGVIHGMGLYPLYVITCLIVAFRYRVSIPHIVAMAAAGLLPFASPLVAIWTLRHIDKRAAEKAAQEAARAARAAKKRAGVPRQKKQRTGEPTDVLPSA